MASEATIREQLGQFKRELAQAEREASRATRRVNYLRQVVDGLNGLLKADEPDSTARLFDVPFNGPDHLADSLSEVAVVTGKTTVGEGGFEPPSNGGGAVLRGRDAVRAVLAESRREWTIPDLTAEIQRRGWMRGVERPRDATASSVQRLVTDGEAERVGRGVYRLRLDQLPPPSEEGDG